MKQDCCGCRVEVKGDLAYHLKLMVRLAQLLASVILTLQSNSDWEILEVIVTQKRLWWFKTVCACTVSLLPAQ